MFGDRFPAQGLLTSTDTHQTAPTQFVEAAGIRFAYRRFGRKGGVPLLFFMHFTGTMDHWDPAVTDGFAQDREVISFNNAGVSSSSGEVPASIEEMARHAAAFVDALGIKTLDALGFSMGWFLRLMEELAIECRVGHPTAIRKAETRRQKHDRRDAALLLQLLAEDRFPAIWMPSTEYRDLRSLLLHRHQWVRMRTRVQNALHAIVLAHGVRRGHTLWNREGQALLASLPLAPHTADRRSELQALYQHLQAHIDRLDDQVRQVANERVRATLLMTHPGVGPVTALATDVFVGDPARFLDGKALASYVGMIPREHSSGKRQRLGALSKQGNPFLRFLWCEAAAHAVRRDPDLQRFYRRKVVQKGFAKARVAAARKLGIRLWIILRDQIDYAEFCRRGLARQS
jgi:transposase